MGFADGYLARQSWEPLIDTGPSKNVRCIAVIPSYREDQLHRTLFSLLQSDIDPELVEVIVVVNVPENADLNLQQESLQQINDLQSRFSGKAEFKIPIHFLPLQILPSRDAGVGLARKIGMDEASGRLNKIGIPDGIIVSCDADALYEAGFFSALINHFDKNRPSPGCSIYFEHLTGEEFSTEVNKAIIQYELYLRYYRLAFAMTGHPHAFHTIGSSFAVRADAYCRQGGMNKRKAGEDFYFLQKIIPLGQYTNMNSTTILLSPRPSDRVPFGTGAAVAKIVGEDSETWLTYQIDAFRILGKFFHDIEISTGSRKDFQDVFEKMENMILKEYLEKAGFVSAIEEITGNTASKGTCIKRFYGWFNAFRVLKFMNFSHEQEFVRKNVIECTRELIIQLGFDRQAIPPIPQEILKLLRKIEREDRSIPTFLSQ